MKKNLPVPQELRARLKMMSGYYEAKNALSQSRFPVVKKSYVIKSDGDEIDEMTDRVNGILEGEITKLRDHALGVVERFVNSLEVAMCDFLKEHGVEPVDLVLGNDPFWRLKELPMVITTYGFEERLIFKGLGDLLLTRGKIMGLDEYPGFAVSALDNVFEAGVSSVFKKMGIIIKDEKKTELLTAEGSDA